MHLTLTLETLRCDGTADPDQDELFCNLHTGEGIHRRPVGTVPLGNWTGGDYRIVVRHQLR